MGDILAAMDADGDGDIDSAEWAAGYAQLGKSAPGVPNPAVWYGTLPGGPSFKIEQISMQKPYCAVGKGQMPPSQLKNPPDYRDETKKGVMVGYAGHVPRARDKVGGAPLGNLPGTPVSPNGKVGIDMEAMMNGIMVRSLPEGREKTFAHHEVKSGYVSEARDQATTGGVKPQLYGEVRPPPARPLALRPSHNCPSCAEERERLARRSRLLRCVRCRASSRATVGTSGRPSFRTARRFTSTASRRAMRAVTGPRAPASCRAAPAAGRPHAAARALWRASLYTKLEATWHGGVHGAPRLRRWSMARTGGRPHERSV